MLLNINNLTVSFPGANAPAVNNLNLSIKQGEILSIVGESGSGKSVTSLATMGLLPSSAKISGKITLQTNQQQYELTSLNNRAYQKLRGNIISMIFQEPMTSLNPVHRCGKQVSEVLRLHKKLSRKEAKTETLKLFNEVQLPRPEAIFKAYPHQISGGQKQRVMIAMAMACKPTLLIADEPTTALDVTVQKNILELMIHLQQTYNTSIIFITHDLGVVADIAHNVAVMYKGNLVEYGSVKQIFTQPQHPYTRGLLACRPPLNQRPEQLLTVADFLNNTRSVQSQQITLQQRQAQHNLLYQQTPMLSVQELDTWYPAKRSFFGKTTQWIKAVNKVSFDLYPGETLGLVGESGCGKTTLGRTLIGLLQATSGQINIFGHNLQKLSRNDLRQLRKNIQIIFQDPYSSLNPRITIGRAIEEPIIVHKLIQNSAQRKARVMELLSKVDLAPHHYNRYPHELSGGQRQRVCIARALALNPQFIVCDESVSALDVSVQAQVLNLLNKLKQEFNFTYIFISHDLSVVRYMSDRIIVMKNGHIIEAGEADALCNNPSSSYTKKLIQAIPGQTNPF